MRRLPAAILVAAALILPGCASSGSTPPVVITPSVMAASTQPATTHTAVYPATWKLPDRKLSPGAIQPGYTIADICPHVNPALEAMRPTAAEKEAVYRAYGITSHPPGKFEIDHVNAVELLGLVAAPAGDPTLNLYPELNDTPDPAMIAKYHLSPAYVHNSKDILEDVLHQKVCAGTVPLATAQQAIMTDWRAAYVRYVGKPPAG